MSTLKLGNLQCTKFEDDTSKVSREIVTQSCNILQMFVLLGAQSCPPPYSFAELYLREFSTDDFQPWQLYWFQSILFSHVDPTVLTGHSQKLEKPWKAIYPHHLTLSPLAPIQGHQLSTYMYMVCSVT